MESKDKERMMARRLRERGLSLKEILNEVSASKSSISSWIRDIELTPEQKKRLKDNGRKFGNSNTADFYRKNRKLLQENGAKMLETYGDGFLCGCMLYWGEGTKDKNVVNMINTDQYLLKYFIQWVEKYFAVPKEKIMLNCTFPPGFNHDEIERFWLKELNLPKTSLYKSIEVESLRKNYPMGMARIIIYRTDIVQAIYGAIQARCGFLNKKWLG
ncbi:MAG: hypothetical protein M0R32_10675 [Candidatus Cloacimonetes bacterium]|jgi:hypothetical protein|nr:hypothetical protein [Candidatus Cloacimonadota bacterium]